MRAVMNRLPLQALAVLLVILSANGAPYSSESYVPFIHHLTAEGGNEWQVVANYVFAKRDLFFC